jgi:hypothetical protein
MTLAELMADVRGTVFTVNGTKTDLNDISKVPNISETALIRICNAACAVTSNDLRFKTIIKSTTLVRDSDVIALPPDFLSIDNMIVYPDFGAVIAEGSGNHDGAESATVLTDADKNFLNDAKVKVGYTIRNLHDGSSATITQVLNGKLIHTSLTGGSMNIWVMNDQYDTFDPNSVSDYRMTQGYIMRPAASLRSLQDNKSAYHFDKITDDRIRNAENIPTQYLITYASDDTNYREGTFISIFDTIPRQNYYLDISYYPEHKKLVKTDNIETIRTYEQLYYENCCALVAQRLGDLSRQRGFERDYVLHLEKFRNTIRKRTRSSNMRSRSLQGRY